METATNLLLSLLVLTRDHLIMVHLAHLDHHLLLSRPSLPLVALMMTSLRGELILMWREWKKKNHHDDETDT